MLGPIFLEEMRLLSLGFGQTQEIILHHLQILRLFDPERVLSLAIIILMYISVLILLVRGVCGESS